MITNLGGSGPYFRPLALSKTLYRIAEVIERKFPEIPEFRLWYNDKTDYHMLSFRLEGNDYDIRFYKIFACTRNGDERILNTRIFGYEWGDVSFFFRSGRFRTYDWYQTDLED